jgi:hypothetical protein
MRERDWFIQWGMLEYGVFHYHGWIIHQQYAANWEALACREIIVFLHTPVVIKGQLQDALA